jgi:hypothetical protein
VQDGIESNFHFRTKETADLFLALIIRSKPMAALPVRYLDGSSCLAKA